MVQGETVAGGGAAHAGIRVFADVPASGAGGFHRGGLLKPALGKLFLKNPMRQRAAADVSSAHKHYVDHRHKGY
jgi:hypothetical protein